MKIKQHQKVATIWLFAILMVLSIQTSFAQNTTFTYQGKLNDNDNPANANYDLQFTLWDSLAGRMPNSATQYNLGSIVS